MAHVEVGALAHDRVDLEQQRRHVAGTHELQTERLDAVVDVHPIPDALVVRDVEIDY